MQITDKTCPQATRQGFSNRGVSLVVSALTSGRHALRAIANRAKVAKLSQLDDHLLADIGIDRPTIADALGVGWLSDPSHRLEELRRQRLRR